MINLDTRPEKYAASINQLEKYGIRPSRFSAIDGGKLSIDVLNQLGVRLADPKINKKVMGKVFRNVDGIEYRTIEFIENPELTYFCTGITRGAIGCILSHLAILQDAYQSQYNMIWVMEDDIQVVEDPSQIAELIFELNRVDPSWDILFTDVDSKNMQGCRVPCRGLAMRPDVSIEPIAFYLAKFEKVNNRISKIGMRYGTYSMILSRLGIEKILNYYKTHAIYLPYDCDYWLIPSLKMYGQDRDIVSVNVALPTDNHP
jgi:GR25 family glycosyltransferase involved in LPS biosynthesis